MRHIAYPLLVVWCCFFCGCGRQVETDAPPPLTLFAAASTTEVMKELGKIYTEGTGTDVTLNLASSGTLAKQIQSGAPADIYVSANVEWMNVLQEDGFLAEASRFDLARNRLVLITPKASPFQVKMSRKGNLADAFEGYLAVGDFKSVPAGSYAKEALVSLGWFDQLEGRFAFGHDVRQVLMQVARNEAQAGIVYDTDARQSTEITVVGIFPEGSHRAIIYPVASLANSTHPQSAGFLAFLKTEKATGILKKYGFAPTGKD